MKGKSGVVGTFLGPSLFSARSRPSSPCDGSFLCSAYFVGRSTVTVGRPVRSPPKNGVMLDGRSAIPDTKYTTPWHTSPHKPCHVMFGTVHTVQFHCFPSNGALGHSIPFPLRSYDYGMHDMPPRPPPIVSISIPCSASTKGEFFVEQLPDALSAMALYSSSMKVG